MSGTEAEAITVLAQDAAGFHPIHQGDGWARGVVPETFKVVGVDWSAELLSPRRSRGVISLYDASSFLAALEQRSTGTPVLYADEAKLALVGVLDDDHADIPGWRQYRVSLTMRPTSAWATWRSGSDKLFTQEEFAEFVEEHSADFISPDSATMLDLAQSIEGTLHAKFQMGSRLSDGARQVSWVEDVTTRAGKAGQLSIPDRFTLALRPFLESDRVSVEALLRLRIRDGQLRLAYRLIRPDELERAVFASIVSEVSEEGGRLVLRGPAPD